MQTTEDPSIAAIIGTSPQILDLKQAVLKIAPRNTTVLITGETGTGKELFAQALHQGSLRRFKPFVRVNCAAIPETLLESELFGYAEGTFTGGKKGGYMGKFALADGGTVFLDELAELPLPLQAKLLRFLQEHEIQRLGETMPRRVNVRVVAATNANLAQLVKYKKFRSDLYYRLNVVTLEIPPLRNRREDIAVLSQAFLKQLNAEYDYRVYRLNSEMRQIFDIYPWPGNVRELHNIMETAFNLHDGGQELGAEHLPQYLRQWRFEQVERANSLDQAANTLNVSDISDSLIGVVTGSHPAGVSPLLAKPVKELQRQRKDKIRLRRSKLASQETEAKIRVQSEENSPEMERWSRESQERSQRPEEAECGVPLLVEVGVPRLDQKPDQKDKRADGESFSWEEWIGMIGCRPLTEITDLFEGELLRYLLHSRHSRTSLASILGISRQALYKKLQKYHLR